jgi:nucleotide-binding universal stress UspA family protein
MPVVVGHDGHRAAQAALAAAVELAVRIGAPLHVVHSVTLADYGVDPDAGELEADCERNLALERESIAAALEGSDVPWTYHEEHGEPADRIAELAESVDASYIVVGATHRGLVALIGGSVSKRLVRLQSRPVVVVPEPSAMSGRGHHRQRRQVASTDGGLDPGA